jgi:hypothetical protein
MNQQAQKIGVSGYISDSKTGETLIGAHVVNSPGSSSSVSNPFGFYTLSLPVGEPCKITYSYTGYSPVSISFTPQVDTFINVQLLPGTMLEEVRVTATPVRRIEEKAEMGRLHIPMQTIKLLPSITGEPDILRAFQLMPGIQSGAEGNNGLYTRGGTPDQNLFLMDDVPLYNVSHLGGLFSVFDPSMVKSVDFYKGGFPARYGGRLSSVVDVRNKDGNLYTHEGEMALGIFLGKFFLEGPIKKDKSSFAFSIRKSNLGIYSYLHNKIVENNTYTQGYTFHDISLKLHHKFSKSDRIFFSAFHGRDKIYYKENDVLPNQPGTKLKTNSDLVWGNTTASARWLHVFNERIFNNVTLAYTRYLYKNMHSFNQTMKEINRMTIDEYLLLSGIDNIFVKTSTEIPFHRQSLRFGGIISRHSCIPGYVSFSQKEILQGKETTLADENAKSRLNTLEWYGFTEFEFASGSSLTGNIGFRTGIYRVENKNFSSFEPRAILNYQFAPRASVKVSFCSMQQNLHFLSNSTIGMPSDVWIPSTRNLRPGTSNQLSLGLAHTSPRKIEVSVEAYFKVLRHLVEFKEGTLLYNPSRWDTKLEAGGSGKVKGIELLINKKSGSLTGWVGYTLSSNTRVFAQINNGQPYPFKYDQRHNFSIVGCYALNRKYSLSATWVYNTGYNITLPTGKYEIIIQDYAMGRISGPDGREELREIHIYSKKNGYQLPDYHRLDIGFNKTIQKRKGVTTWSWGLYNAYNRQNSYYVFFKKTKQGELKLYQQSLFPVLLNFSYSYKF